MEEFPFRFSFAGVDSYSRVSKKEKEWNRLSAECGSWRPLRPERRRWMKWEFAIQQYATESGLGMWARAAADKDTWESHRDDFAVFACRSL